mgnify:CR=1 FL=1
MFNYKTKPVRLEKPLTHKEKFDKWVNKHYFTLLIILTLMIMFVLLLIVLLCIPSATESGMLRNYLIRGI